MEVAFSFFLVRKANPLPGDDNALSTCDLLSKILAESGEESWRVRSVGVTHAGLASTFGERSSF